MDTINITAGCDETFVVTLYKNGVIFPVESATNVTVRLLAFKKTINCEYSITASGELTFTLTGMDKAGVYDLEISGNLDGYAWRTCGRNVIEYTYETVKGDTSAVVAGDDFDISMEVQLYVGESGSTGGFVTEEQLQEVADSIPEYLSELAEDTEHQTVSDEEKTRWNNNSVPTKLSELENDVPYATQTWVNSQGFVTSLAGYATESWVSSQGYLTEHQSLAGYATETWVSSQGYLTEHQSLSGYATETWVSSQGYLTSHQDISGKEDTSNKVTSVSASSTDTQYPSAKCVYDLVGDIETLLSAI